MLKQEKSLIVSGGLLIVLGLIWGSSYAIARYVVLHDVKPLGYAFWQTIGPGVLLCIFILCRGNKIHCSKRYLRYYVIMGVLGIVIPNSNMFVAAQHVPAGILSIVINIAPIIIYPLALLFRQERFCLGRLFSVFLGMSGILLLLLPQAGFSSSSLTHWIWMALITPCCFAFGTIYISKYRPGDDTLVLIVGMLLFASLFLIPAVMISGQFYMISLPFTRVDWVILLEIFLTGIGYIVLFELIKRAGPVYYSLVGGIVILTGLFWGWFIFLEQLTIRIVVSVCLILLAIMLMGRFHYAYEKRSDKNSSLECL